MSEALSREMDRAFHRAQKRNSFEAHTSAIIAMLSTAFKRQDEPDVLNFLGGKQAAALFAETFDDAICAQKRTGEEAPLLRPLLPIGMEEARNRLMKIAGVHADGNGGYCQLDDGSWAALTTDECPRCGYQRGE